MNKTTELFGVQVISAGTLSLIVVCMATEGDRWSLWRRLLFVPGSFLAHVVLTLPVASSFGILMRMSDRERTVPEHKAIFILSALPILVFAMRQSRLFTRRVKVDEAHRNPKISGITTGVFVLLMAMVAIGVSHANTSPEVPQGPYLGVPLPTAAFSLEFQYNKPGFSELVTYNEWLSAWGWEVGWRFTRSFSLGLSLVNSKDSGDDLRHEYSHLLLRVDVNPTGSWWWVSASSGFANIEGIEHFGPGGNRHVPTGSGVIAAIGLGADMQLSEALVLRGRGEYLRERPWLLLEGGNMDVDGWAFGAMLVWFP